MKIYNILKCFFALLFLIVNINAQVVTNTATLYSSVTQADNTIVPSVPIPITIVRTNGRIVELSLNISNVSQNAQKINLRVYELIYTTNVVETPLTNAITSGGTNTTTDPTGGTTGGGTGGGTTGGTGGGTTDPTGGTTGGGTTGGTTGGGTTSTNYVYVTNNVSLNVTLQTQTGTTNDVQIPAQTVWHNDQLHNILFDITSLPPDAIILRFRILDYIYDENGNLVGPQQSGTNSNGTGTGGSGTGTGTGGTGTGSGGTNTGGTGGTGSTGGTGGNTTTPTSDTVQFPVEVLGADQHTEQFKLVLNDDVSKLHGLKLKVHGLGYTNKMSISVNDSPWITLNNTNVDFPSKWDRAMYGMIKNHSTLTFVVPFAPNNIAKTEINNIKVRFNDIDKETVGYRILDADLVKSEPNGYEAKVNYNQRYLPTIGIYTNWVNKYTPLTLTTVKTQDDPKNWVPLSTDASVINRGKNIWFNGDITERGVAIKAKCTDCHTTDGFDLKYFNYSDKSIIARSKYHGLNDDDSESIAAYIRSLNVPYQEKGRPWNPPYQPGPGLDSKPILSWAAGAGIEAVAENDIDTLKALFPNGTKNGIKYDDGVGPIDFKKSLNIREIPIVIQLPDWNHWLPKKHIKDAAPELWDYFEKTNGYKVFTWQRAVAMSPPTTDPAKFLINTYRGFDEKYAYAYIQADQGGVLNQYIENQTNTWANIKIRNVINPSYRHSIVVKHWEILNKFGLQDLGHAVFDPNYKDQWNNQGHYIMGNKPESFFISKGVDYKKVIQKRRWFDTYTFHLAPHIGGESIENRGEWGPQSFQWYQLQMILDDSNRNPDRNAVDWGYLLALQHSTLDHQNGGNHLYTIFSHAIALMNQIKTSEAFEFQIGNPINTGPLEGRYFAARPSSWQFISDGADWQNGFDFDHRWAGWTVKYAPGFANNSEYFAAVKDVANAWFDAEISKFHEIDSQYLKDTGLSEGYINFAEAGLRYIGGDADVINKIVALRNKVWPNNTYVNKITKFYPQPYPQWNPGTSSGGTSGTGTGTGGTGTGTGGTSTGGTSTGTINPTPPPVDAVQFPVEVLGADQHTEEFKFVLNDNLNDIYGAKFTIHALGFTNKASVSINNSAWIPLNNRTVIFPRKFERIWTGIGGFQNTLTMVVPFASNNIIPSVTNTIKFKFNDITKQTVGYRVLNADIVRRQDSGEKEFTYGHGSDTVPGKFYTNIVYNYPAVTLATTKTFDDPKTWTPKSTDPVVINQGKDLWFNGNISERGVALKAKCTDCHFTDGYDLKYFNYSDKSIIARSKYHGLSEQQGVALASYIRSLDVPYQEKGRPWNPLYQPGPGMSKVPIDNWAAGAGMDWVLDDDIKSFKYIFPNGTTNGIVYNGVVQPIDFKKAYNINDIPIAMQLPDWNHWLPVAHLKDSAPEIWDWSLAKGWPSARIWIDDFFATVPKDQGLKGLVQKMRSQGEAFGYNLVHMDQGFYQKYADAGKHMYYAINIRMAYRHWVNMRNFEIMQRWKMQDLGHEILEDNANTRDQWGERGARMYIDLAKLDKIKAQFGSSYTNVFNDRRWFANTWPFHLAPHIGNVSPGVTDQNSPMFTYEPYGDQSSQWYQLQMYLDDSNRMPEYNIVDWGYLHNILWASTSQWGDMAKYSLYTGKHNALQFLNTVKTYEAFQFNNDYKGLIEGQWNDVHPHIRLLGGTTLWDFVSSSDYNHYHGFTMHYIDALHSKEKKDMMVGVYNQIFKAQLDRLEEYPAAANPNLTFSSENMLRYMGGDPALIQRFVDFRKKTWPDNNWVSKITHVWPQPFYPAL